tara:strand:+ start:4015 stop:6249 length:2235 start_codon:yes stop_codon:yes gene_type:complete
MIEDFRTNFSPATKIDRETIETYLKTVYGYCEGYVPIRMFMEKGVIGGTNNFQQLHWIPLTNLKLMIEQVKPLVERGRNFKMGVYVIPGTVAERNQAKATDIINYPCFIIDIDSGDIEAAKNYIIEQLGQPTLEIYSGGKTEANVYKRHLYWKLTEPATGVDIQRLTSAQKLAAKKIGADPSFGSAHQPIRLPGGVHQKNNKASQVRIANQSAMEYELEELIESVESMSIMPGLNVAPEKLEDRKAAMEDMYRNDVFEGGEAGETRFDNMGRAIGFALNRHFEGHWTLKEAWDDVLGYNQTKVNPPWEEERVKKDFDRIYKRHYDKYGAPKPKPTEHKLEGDDWADIVDDDTPLPPEIIGGLLREGEFMVIAGPPKSQKSLLMQEITYCIATGNKLLNRFDVEIPQQVVVIQAEMSKAQLSARLKAVKVNPAEKALLKRNAKFTYRFTKVLNDEGSKDVIDWVERSCGNDKPQVIIFDPLSNIFDGEDENSNVELMKFIRDRIWVLRDMINPKAAIILIHHSNKVNRNQMMENPFLAIRGASAIQGAYDVGLFITKTSEDTQDRRLFFQTRAVLEPKPMTVHYQEGHMLDRGDAFDRDSGVNITDKMGLDRFNQVNKCLGLLFREAAKGQYYNKNQFALKFADKYRLGGASTIKRNLNQLLTQGWIMLFDGEQVGQKIIKGGKYLCIKDMPMWDSETKSVKPNMSIRPTHLVDGGTGEIIEVSSKELDAQGNVKWMVSEYDFNE